MKSIIRDYLTFNKRERNGVFILLSIIGGQLIYLNISENFVTKEQTDFSKFEKDLLALQDSMQIEKESFDNFANPSLSVRANAEKKEPVRTERFNFDPNSLPDAEWKRLGLSQKQIKTIKNYESKGGKFRKKEDLKKMYCIKEELYNSLEPYILIASSRPVFEKGEVKILKPSASSLPVLVELNSADSAQLTTVKGIGPFYAKNIIKYRNLLGGFVAKEQLMEVWKFDAEKYAGVERYIIVDPSKIRKININTCEADQLKGPYIKWNAANAIVNYRKAHGKFKTIEDIRLTDLVDEETLRKIAPYLVIE